MSALLPPGSHPLLRLFADAVSRILASDLDRWDAFEAAVAMLSRADVVAVAPQEEVEGCDGCERSTWALPLTEHDDGDWWRVQLDGAGDPDIQLCPSCNGMPAPDQFAYEEWERSALEREG